MIATATPLAQYIPRPTAIPMAADDPQARRRREAADGHALAEDRAGAEEADTGHDLRRDAGRIDRRPGASNPYALTIVNRHAPTATSMCVRSPAACSRSSRSMPMTMPIAAATTSRIDDVDLMLRKVHKARYRCLEMYGSNAVSAIAPLTISPLMKKVGVPVTP